MISGVKNGTTDEDVSTHLMSRYGSKTDKKLRRSMMTVQSLMGPDRICKARYGVPHPDVDGAQFIQNSNPDTRVDSWKCGQDHGGKSNKGPNEWLAVKFAEMHDLYQGVQGKNSFSVRQYQQGIT